MSELRSIKEPMELDFEAIHDSDDAYFGDEEIAVVGMGLVLPFNRRRKTHNLPIKRCMSSENIPTT